MRRLAAFGYDARFLRLVHKLVRILRTIEKVARRSRRLLVPVLFVARLGPRFPWFFFVFILAAARDRILNEILAA